VLAVSIATWRFARDLWGRREAFLAAGLMAFFLNFDLPAAVIPIAPDMFLLLPHIVAVHCAWKGKAVAGRTVVRRGVSVPGQRRLRAGGVRAAGVARASRVGGGIRHPERGGARGTGRGGCAAVLLPAGLGVERGLRAQFVRTPSAGSTDCAARADWLGFHAALAIGAAAFWWENRKRENYWLAGWLVLSFAGVALGARFFPRYFLQILPPMVLLASHALARRKAVAWIAAVALLVPAVRFGPRYVTLAHDLLAGRPPEWADIALDRDSRAAADLVNQRKHPGDTLFVWGYRPGIFIYTRMPAGSKFWDSQALTGVPADRHLRDTEAVLPDQAAHNRSEFAH
jgi:hypothetical protein